MKLRLIHKINVIRMILDSVLGKNHSHGHRMVAGATVMAVGVFIAKGAGEFVHLEIVHYLADGIGYFIHGMGAVPFIEYFADSTSPSEGEKVRSLWEDIT